MEVMLSQHCECTRCLWLVPFKMINIFKQKIKKKNIQMRDDGGFYEGGSGGGGEMWLESAHVPEVELTEFADGLGVRREIKKRVKMTVRLFDLKSCEDEVSIY